MIEKIKVFFYLNNLFAQMLFFSVFAFMGLSYSGSDQNNVYISYLIISSFITYFISFDRILRRKKNKSILYLLLFVIGLVIISGIFKIEYAFVKTQLALVILMVIPAIFAGNYMASTINRAIPTKILFYFSLIVVFGVIRTLPSLLSVSVTELFEIFGGGQYQALSYFCSFAGLVLFSENLKRTKYYSLSFFCNIIFIAILFIGVVLSGGRGGLIVLIFGSIFVAFYNGGVRLVSKFILVALVMLTSFFVFSNGLYSYTDRIDQSIARLFSFISSKGIDMDGSSNRDEFYLNALILIKQNLIFGLGFFGTVDLLGDYYPHNLFLEVLLQGGIIYLLITILILVIFFYRLYLILKRRKNEDVILITVIYSFIMLMFSNSYIQEPVFWFSISYVFSYPLYTNLQKDENTGFNC